jgi:hypothetical protein
MPMEIAKPFIIYESPDNGKTIYARSSGNIDRVRIDSSGSLGIGTINPGKRFTMDSYNEWNDILKSAEKNTAVKSALDKLRTTYYLSKDNGSET